MGEDIHFRMYLKRKKDGKYVNAHEVCEWNPEHTTFGEPFSGRNYDVFSLFGSGRGNYAPLGGMRFGMPGFLSGSDFDEYCKAYGFYGFVWFKAPELEQALSDFLAKLTDPLKYLDEDSDEYLDWKDLLSPGNKTAEQMRKLHEMYTAWYDEHSVMLSHASELYNNVRHFTSTYCSGRDGADPADPRNAYYRDSPHCKMFDMDETVFLFFFDN